MIFATVGSQLPFDRMLAGLEIWARNNPHVEIVAQIGRSDFSSESIKTVNFLTSEDYEDCFKKCHAVVSHDGIGSIFSALKHSKPLLLVPRLADLNETLNDRGFHVGKELAQKYSFLWEDKIENLPHSLDVLLAGLTCPNKLQAPTELLAFLDEYLREAVSE